MSLEARLKSGFERATTTTRPPTDLALTNLIATYHAQRKQRVMLAAAAAIVAVLVATLGDGAVRWVDGLQRVRPADNGRDAPLRVERGQLRADRGEEATVRRPGSTNVTRTTAASGLQGRPFQPPDRSESGGSETSSSTTTHDDTRTSSSTDGMTDPGEPRDLTRVVTEKWSNAPDGNSGVTTFPSIGSETHIRVKLEGTGGGGSSELAADVYEIVDGEKRLVAALCSYDTYSDFLPITAGAQIEVRVASGGCNGTDLDIKGTVDVAFYE